MVDRDLNRMDITSEGAKFIVAIANIESAVKDALGEE